MVRRPVARPPYADDRLPRTAGEALASKLRVELPPTEREPQGEGEGAGGAQAQADPARPVSLVESSSLRACTAPPRGTRPGPGNRSASGRLTDDQSSTVVTSPPRSTSCSSPRTMSPKRYDATAMCLACLARTGAGLSVSSCSRPSRTPFRHGLGATPGMSGPPAFELVVVVNGLTIRHFGLVLPGAA